MTKIFKKAFSTIALLAIMQSGFATAVHAETLDEALAKATHRYDLKQKKKAVRDAVKAKYKGQIEALKQKQKEEVDAEMEKMAGF